MMERKATFYVGYIVLPQDQTPWEGGGDFLKKVLLLLSVI